MMTIHLNRHGQTYLDIKIRENMQPDVFNEPIIVEAIRDIDRVYKIEGLAMYTHEFGVLSPADLSNGMKALILCYYDAVNGLDFLVSNCCIAENVLPYLARLSLKYNFNISMDYPMLFGLTPVTLCAKDIDTGTVMNDSFVLADFYKGRAGED